MDGSYQSSHKSRHSTVTPDPFVSLLLPINVQTSSLLSATGFPPISLALSKWLFSFSGAGQEFPAPVRHVSSSCSQSHGVCHEAVSQTEEREVAPFRLRVTLLPERRELLYGPSLSWSASVKWNAADQRERQPHSSSFAQERGEDSASQCRKPNTHRMITTDAGTPNIHMMSPFPMSSFPFLR